MGKKLAVLFPGMGYTCTKPLLYYARALCDQAGYETVRLDYGEILHDKEKAFPLAYERVMPHVLALPYQDYEEVVFVAKSLGTVLAAIAETKLNVPIRQVFLTPVEETITHYRETAERDEVYADSCKCAAKNAGRTRAIALSGSADPWVPDHEHMRAECEKKGIRFYSFPSANHSLESGSVEENLDNMKRVMSIIKEFLEKDD